MREERARWRSFFPHSPIYPPLTLTYTYASFRPQVAEHCPNARLVLRILTDDSYSVCRFGMKFGANAERVPRLLERAKELNLDVVGISFHVGSGCYNADAFGDAVMRARHAFNVGKGLGFDFDFLDLGGGFPGTDDVVITFAEIARVLNDALALHFPPSTNVRIIAEPGRYYAAGAYTLAVNVIAKRLVPPQKQHGGEGDASAEQIAAREDSAMESSGDSPSASEYEDGEDEEEVGLGVPSSRSFVAENAPEQLEEQKPGFMYYVNDGVYGSFNCILYDHADPKPKVLVRAAGSTEDDSTFVVCSCTNGYDFLPSSLPPPSLFTRVRLCVC